MDFAFTQEQEDIRNLAGKILGDLAAPERLPDFEQDTEWCDERMWQALAEANLLGVALPEDAGGMGFGFFELCVLLEQIGRAVAPVPAIATLVMGALPIARFGSDAQKRRWLPGVVAGTTLLTGAFADAYSRDPQAPATLAARSGGGWRLDGTKLCVPAAKRAACVVVPARTDEASIVLALVDPSTAGVALEAQASTTGEVLYDMRLQGVEVAAEDVLAGPSGGRDALRWLIEHTTAALCALELGVADKALRTTAKYAAERKQFGKPIATFQAVAQRAADAYIDLEAVRLSTWQAVWRLANGEPATREVAIAKFWASEGGHRVVYAAQHLHGGIGVDKDYPLHRHYLLSKQIELMLGGAHTHLARLGAMLAA